VTPVLERRRSGRTRLPITPLERVAIVVASLLLSLGLIAVLSGFFAGRDQAGVSGNPGVPGQAFRDLGHEHLRPGQPRLQYNSNPPTSGPHVPERVLHDQAPLNDDQLLQALQLGDVVIVYGGPAPPPGLVSAARALAPPFTPALAAAGQAVIISPRGGTARMKALAWAHMLRVGSAGDPRLRRFVLFWLGRGAPGR
jgi:hypothetical protein